MPFVDSHCHLSFSDFEGKLPDLLARMRTANVSHALCVCTTLEEFDRVHGLALDHPNLFASVGVHPDNEGVTEPNVADLVTHSKRPKVVAIGETGLDYYRLNGRTVADMAWQRERFAVHIQAARETDLPLIVHTRSASADTLSLLKSQGQGGALPQVKGVFHCFTETQEVARGALDLGFDVSFSGIASFKNAADLREVIAMTPLNRLLIETDSPYLAPVPHRGKTNEPSFVPHVAQVVAQVKGLSLAEVESATTDNFFRLFSRAKAD
jgi:TatD DNase family protein